jgi:thiamine-phosphate pyrophosphorylase
VDRYNAGMDPAIYRVLDANLNRAREGLRVIEEYVRFVRDDGRGAAILKRWRHELRRIVDRLDPERLLSARSAAGDVGKDLVSPSNSAKQDPASIATASFKRLQESLRVIEEYSAAVDPVVNRSAGTMRFEVYEFEKKLFLESPRARFEAVRLYLLVGSDVCPADRISEIARQALRAGVDCLQLREKKLPDRPFLALAETLAGICREERKLFIVNDRADIARAAGADGVHVGQDDLPVDAVRRILGPDKIIGISTHNLDQLHAAVTTNPTYIAVGPAFDTATKPRELAAGVGYVAAAVEELRTAGIPEVAVGGLTPANLPRLISAGIRRVAVCGAILSAANVPSAVQQFIHALMPAWPAVS